MKMPKASVGGDCCSAISCSNSRRKCPGLSFFKFPKDSERCKLWVLNSGRLDLLNKDVNYIHMNFVFCADHFEENQCMNPKKNKLIWNAVPTLFDIPKKSIVTKKQALHQKNVPQKVHALRCKRISSKFSTKTHQNLPDNQTELSFKSCLYLYCRNCSRYENREFMKGIVFVPFPSAAKDIKQRRLWLESCGRFDLSKSRNTDQNEYYVCSVHFEGGSGPTAEHPNPIPHRVAQEFIKRDGTIEIRGNSHHVPALLPHIGRTSAVSGEVVPSQPTLDLLPSEKLEGKEVSLPHYEITVRELPPSFPPSQYSLSEIRANYVVPYDWAMCITINTIFFTKIKEDTHCLLVRFTIRKDMSTQLQALCRELDSTHPLLDIFPKTIPDLKTLDACFSLLRTWKPCKGNSEEAYVNLFSEWGSFSSYYCPQTGSVHSLKCELLTKVLTSRCKMCQMQRSSMRSVLRRVMKNHPEYLSAENNDAVDIDEHVYEVIQSDADITST